MLVVRDVNERNLHDMVTDFFSTENFGVRASMKPVEPKAERRARMLLERNTVEENGRYTTGLLWKYDNIALPESHKTAQQRFLCFEKQMQKNEEFGSLCRTKMRENIQKGYARKLSQKEATERGPKTWYLPVFAVKNPNKPNKIRLVYDAAAKSNGVSLNDHLLVGPDMLCSLSGVLWRLRQGKVGLTADIREMYHQIRINPSDQDAQRFLWCEDGNEKLPSTYVLNVMSFGACCSPSTAQWVKNFNAKRFSERFPRAVESIVHRHYVDDLVDSFEDDKEAINVAKQIIYIHSQAGFELRGRRQRTSIRRS
jgi:hypothetical protein